MAFFDDIEWSEILDRLTRSTLENKITWSELDPQRPGRYVTDLSGEQTFVISAQHGDGEFPFVLAIYNRNGDAITSIASKPYTPTTKFGSEGYNSQRLDELYLGLQRRISGAEAAYNSILSSLDALLD